MRIPISNALCLLRKKHVRTIAPKNGLVSNGPKTSATGDDTANVGLKLKLYP